MPGRVQPERLFRNGTTYGLASKQQSDRFRDERDAARNRLAAAERRIARLEADNAALTRVIADAFGDALDQFPDPERAAP